MSDSETPADTTTLVSSVTAPQLNQDNSRCASLNQPASPPKPPKTDAVLHDQPGTKPSPPSATIVAAALPKSSPKPGGGSSALPSTLSPKKATTYTQPYDIPGMRMSMSAVLAGNARDMRHRGTSSAGYPAPDPPTPSVTPTAATAAVDKDDGDGGEEDVSGSARLRSSNDNNNNNATGTAVEPETIPPWEKPSSTPPPQTTESASNLTNEQLVRALTSVPPQTQESSDKVTDAVIGSQPLGDSHQQAILGNALAAAAAAAAATAATSAATTGNAKNNGSSSTAIANLAAKFTNILEATATAEKISSNENGTTSVVPAGRRGSNAILSRGSLTQMLDQAIRLGSRRTSQSAAEDEQQPLTKKRKTEKKKRTVRNDKVWQDLAGFQEKRLGTYLYKPGKLLPVNAADLNGRIDVLVPAAYLTYHNSQIKKRALWGTDIYTDDSDVVAMIVHCGKYSMPFVEPDIAPNDPLFLALGVEPDSTAGPSRRVNKPQNLPAMIPDYDLKVTLRVVPTLKHYTGTIQNYIASRAWGSNHDGVSYHVECVEKTQKGHAQPCGRHAIKANMTQYAYDRYVTVGLPATATSMHGHGADDDEVMEEITPAMLWKPKVKKKKKVDVVTSPPTAEVNRPSSSSPEVSTTTTGRRRAIRRAASKGKKL